MLDTFPPEIPVQRIETKPPELEGFVSEVTLRAARPLPAPHKPAVVTREPAVVKRRGTSLFLVAAALVAGLGLAAGMYRVGDEQLGQVPDLTEPPPLVATSQPPVTQAAPASALAPPSPTVTSDDPQPVRDLETVPAERVQPPPQTDNPRPAMTSGRTVPAAPEQRAARMPLPASPAVQEIATAARLEMPSLPAASIEPETVPPAVLSAPTAPTAPPALAPVPAPLPVVISGEGDRLAVRALLERYRGAYERLDANAAGETWPSVDRRALAKAFADLSSQTMRFDDCDINLGENRGVASCKGLASYVGRVGKRAELAQRQWTFLVRKNGDDWRIDSVKTGTR